MPDHPSNFLKLFEVAIDQVRIVFAHPRLERVDHRRHKILRCGRSCRICRDPNVIPRPDHIVGLRFLCLGIDRQVRCQANPDIQPTLLQLSGVFIAFSGCPVVGRRVSKWIAWIPFFLLTLSPHLMPQLFHLPIVFGLLLTSSHRGGSQFPAERLGSRSFCRDFTSILDLVVIALQIVDQRTNLCFALGHNRHQVYRMRNVITQRLVTENRMDLDRRRHAGNVLSNQFPNPCHVAFRIEFAIHAAGFDDDVGQNPLDPVPHLGIDDDHRRHTQRYADDACQCDITSPQISLAEKHFVHGQSFGKNSVSVLASAAGRKSRPGCCWYSSVA